MLCGPPSQKFHGESFRPVRAVPVDMFPHTEHCEMVVVFSRVSEVGDGGGAAEREEGVGAGVVEGMAVVKEEGEGVVEAAAIKEEGGQG
jgi:hypothetical protein